MFCTLGSYAEVFGAGVVVALVVVTIITVLIYRKR